MNFELETSQRSDYWTEMLPEERQCFIELLPEEIETIQQLNRLSLPLSFMWKARVVIKSLVEDFQLILYMLTKRLLKQIRGIKLNWSYQLFRNSPL